MCLSVTRRLGSEWNETDGQIHHTALTGMNNTGGKVVCSITKGLAWISIELGLKAGLERVGELSVNASQYSMIL